MKNKWEELLKNWDLESLKCFITQIKKVPHFILKSHKIQRYPSCLFVCFLKKTTANPNREILLLTFWYKPFQDFFLLIVALFLSSLSKYKIVGSAKWYCIKRWLDIKKKKKWRQLSGSNNTSKPVIQKPSHSLHHIQDERQSSVKTSFRILGEK